MLVTPTTVTTTKPNPFLLLRQGFLQSNLNIDISKSPEILKQITDEAKTLGAPQTFKVIAPIIKGQILSSAEILNAFINNTPAELKNGLGEKYILYAYYGEFKPSLGLVFTLKENQTDAVKRSFLN
ncbi:MAG: hypothetical protein KO464_01460 [Candidatus Methanofastidiosum sp.]|nr:hypothetical protein [Methanofastidiosum sp.]